MNRDIPPGMLRSLLPLLLLLVIQATGNAQSYTENEQACFNLVQNKVAYDKAGSTRWSEDNVRRLCAETTNPQATVSCFISKMPEVGWATAIRTCVSTPGYTAVNVMTGPSGPATRPIGSGTQMPGTARDIDAKNGHVWLIGTGAVGDDYEIYKLEGVRRTRVDGAARRIAVDGNGSPWVISSIGMIFRRVGNSFRPVPGPGGGVKPLDIAISNSNEVWIVSDNGTVSSWTGSGWTTLISLNARKVIFTSNPDTFQIVDEYGKRFVRQSASSWIAATEPSRLALGYVEYAIEADQTKWGIDSSFNIWRFDGKDGAPERTLCAKEGERCEFTGTREVIYGAETGWIRKTATNGLDCSYQAFGHDPMENVRKQCYLLQPGATSSVPTGPTTPKLTSAPTAASTPKPPPVIEQIARTITVKNNAGLYIWAGLRQLTLSRASTLAAQSPFFAIGETKTFGNGSKIPVDTVAEVEITMQITEGPEPTMTLFKALLPQNSALTTFCYEVTGTYFVPGVKTCDGSDAHEAKYISFKNEALFSAYVSLTYYPFGKTATKTIRTDTTSLGFQRKIYIPLDADTDKKMTLEIIKTSALEPKSVMLTKAVEISSFDSSCYKVWGTIFSPQAGSCQ